MGRDVDIIIKLHTVFIENVIKKVFERFTRHDIKYIDERRLYQGIWYVSSEQALSLTLEDILSQSIRTVPPLGRATSLSCEMSESFFIVIFCQDINKSVSLLMGPEGNPWYKGDPEDRDIDYDRYFRLLLDACQDFPITHLKTSDTYYDYNGYRL